MKHYFLISLSLLICSFEIYSSESRDESLTESQKSMRGYLRNLSGSPVRTQSPRDASKTESQLMAEMDELRDDSGGLSVKGDSPDQSRQEVLSPTLELMDNQACLIGEVHATAIQYLYLYLGMRQQLRDFEGSADLPSVQQAHERLQELQGTFAQMRDNEAEIKKSYRQVREIVDDMIQEGNKH